MYAAVCAGEVLWEDTSTFLSFGSHKHVSKLCLRDVDMEGCLLLSYALHTSPIVCSVAQLLRHLLLDESGTSCVAALPKISKITACFAGRDHQSSKGRLKSSQIGIDQQHGT